MAIDDQEITIEIENLRSRDMENVKQAFLNLKQMLSDVTPEGKDKINKALTWARSVYGQDIG
jgi:hypothetical protein